MDFRGYQTTGVILGLWDLICSMWPSIGISGALHRILSGRLCPVMLSMVFQRYVVSPVYGHELRHVEVLVCERPFLKFKLKPA
jgi:hypothetical protein